MKLFRLLRSRPVAAVLFVSSLLWAPFCRAQTSSPVIVTNPVSQLVQRSSTALLTVSATGNAPLSYQWRKDAVELVGATDSALSLTNVQATDAGGYDVVVTNDFGSATSVVATLTVNVAITDGFNPGANAEVDSLAFQQDGKMLVGGNFTTLGGVTRKHIGRFNADGTLDSAFNPSASGWVWSVAVQPDRRILVGGDYTNIVGQARSWLCRLNTDGSVDTTFNPNPDWIVSAMVVQPDGSIVIGGLFSHVGTNVCRGIARVKADGTFDPSFNAGVDNWVNALAAQAQGDILVGGMFHSLNGVVRQSIGRLVPTGAIDTSFTNDVNSGSSLYAMAEVDGGKIVVAGTFTTLAGQPQSYIGRFNADGSLDTTFNPTLDGTINSMAARADGNIIIGGNFATVNGVACAHLAKLNADGSVDSTFRPNPDNAIYTLAGAPDGAVVIGGTFAHVAGQSRTRIARLLDGSSASENVLADSSSVTWLRNGTAPEIGRTTFETTTDGVNWVLLGTGERIAGGWQLGGLTLPSKGPVRARGFAGTSGWQSTSGWVRETYGGTQLIVSQPTSRTNNAGTTATFSVTGIAGVPTTYYWLKNGALLSDGGNIFGSSTNTLVLSNVFGADAGSFQAVLSTSSGTVTSAVATLTVRDPMITAQPTNQAVNPGQSVSFSVTAAGTAPLAYQWFLNGVALNGATDSMLNLANVQASDAGVYTVVVSNSFSSVTSTAAGLSVNLAVVDSFDAGLNPGTDSVGGPFVIEPDGKLVIASSFGITNYPTAYLARVFPDGSIDPGFNAPTNLSPAITLALQDDGRILGSGTPAQRYLSWRLTADGAVDITYTNVLNGPVHSLVIEPSGSAWVGGGFIYSKPSILTNLAHLLPDGRVDTNALVGANSTVLALAEQRDGKLVVGGSFTIINGHTANGVARLNSNGVLDTSFSASATGGFVNAIVLQPDGKLLLGGAFTGLNGTSVNCLGRLNPDGSLDRSYNPNVNNWVYSLALQADGQLIIGGIFTSVSGQPRNGLARIKPDGTLDLTFNPNVNGLVYSIGLQGDGELVVAGSFSQIAGQTRIDLARLQPLGPVSSALGYDGTTLTWLRGGATPEVWRTLFESSSDGVNWTLLGAGQRTNGGWQLANVTLPWGTQVRARGFATGGRHNASSWPIEAITEVTATTPPVIVSDDGNFGMQTNSFAFTVRAAAGQTIVTEASVDLVGWVSLQTNTVDNTGEFLFMDPPPVSGQRFYRVRQTGP